MRKTLFSVMLLASALCLFSACDKDKGTDGGDITKPEDLKDSKLTPGEHKSKLQDIAIEFVNYFNPADTEALIDSAMDLSEYLEYGDIMPEYYSLMINDIILGAKTLDPYYFMQFTSRASEDFVIDINNPEINILKGLCLTWDGEEWVESQLSGNIVKIVWDKSEASLTWDDTTKWECNFEEDGVNYVVYIPNTIKFTIKINGKEHLSIIITNKIASSKDLSTSCEVKLNGGYVIKASLSADPYGLKSLSSMHKGNNKLYGSTVIIGIDDFTNIDNWVVEEYDEWSDEYYTTYDPSEYLKNNIKTGAYQLDILNLSILAVGDLQGMHEAIRTYEDMYPSYDDEFNYIEENERKFCEKVCELMNEKCEAIIIYNDTREKIADVIMQVVENEWYGETYYDVEPVMVFPDGSKFAFDDYFTERAFNRLIDKIEDLGDEYYDMIAE